MALQWTWVTANPQSLIHLVSILNKRLKALEGKLGSIDRLLVGTGTFTDADTTPSVDGKRFWITANTSGTSVTTFDDGIVGQHITILFNDGNTTLVHGSTLNLASDTNLTGTSGDTRAFSTDDGTTWYETPQG
ncbi:hypothetical protein LCGC14_2644350 [marine sediment metagenome]|uniref:Uncharacterized protein n=1 Tax=marine sediment metagenome TaxID=412755 RepID=A0A0F8ZWM6_9ZZZZ